MAAEKLVAAALHAWSAFSQYRMRVSQGMLLRQRSRHVRLLASVQAILAAWDTYARITSRLFSGCRILERRRTTALALACLSRWCRPPPCSHGVMD